GRAVDKRADIWAFGCVLFEMLSGQPTFRGDDLADLLSNVLKSEPEWHLLAPEVPAPVRTLLKRCLEKDPARRVVDASTLRFVLEEASSLAAVSGARTVAAVAVPPARPGLLRHAPAAAAVAVSIALAIPAARHLREVRAELPQLRTEIITPATTDPSSFALSTDGRHIVFVADDAGASRLWIRALDSSSALPLAGTENGTSPFWSPDSRAIAFFADGSLKTLDLGGGAPRVVTQAPRSRGSSGAWGADDTIIFAGQFGGPLLKIAATGGEAVRLYEEDDSLASDGLPSFLPDGRRFVFSRTGAAGGLYLGSLDSSEATRLLSSEGAENVGAIYHASGWLLWSRQRRLVAQRLDLDNRRLVGEIADVADSIARGALAKPALAGSATGFVAYRAEHNARRQLTWFDRTGNSLGTAGGADDTALMSVALAPDGRRIAVLRTVQGNQDIWIVDGLRTIRVTVDPGIDTWPRWSPDGRRIVWGTAISGTGSFALYEQMTDSRAPERLPGPPGFKLVNDWSRDGRYILFHAINPQTNRDIWAQPMTGDRTPWPFLRTRFDERFGAFSPDSRWVAYASDEAGQMEIYVRPFDTTASGQWQISTAGGIHPRWRADGKELYYINPAGALMAVPIAVTATTLVPGNPVQLFQTRIAFGGTDVSNGVQYDVSEDGRFLINTLLEDEAGPITLLQNWRTPTAGRR
ncbi:MAG TPA: protein kinase, partial [Vicinamibacterales bacterium]|nr:protein kinase [Vicinamibacterales bacterium]